MFNLGALEKFKSTGHTIDKDAAPRLFQIMYTVYFSLLHMNALLL